MRLSSSDLVERVEGALASAAPRQVEVSAIRQDLGVTRFSGGRIHQNVQDQDVRVWARVWSNGGAGYAATTDLSPEGLDAVVRDAAALSKDLSGSRIDLPSSVPSTSEAYFSATAACDAPARAAVVDEIHAAVGDDLASHGNLRIADQTVALVNSVGLRASYDATYAALNLVLQGADRSTGYGGSIGRDTAQLDFVGAARRAAAAARSGRAPLVARPGHYEVLLHPPAVSMLLVSLGYVGLNCFGASALRSGDSFLAGAIGRRVGSELFTLVDDPLDPSALFTPFDAEGTPRTQLTIVDGGVARGVAHDLTSGSIDGTASTGHALPPGDKGPTPHSLSIPAGSTPVDDIIAGMERGLIVHRIHPFVSLRGGPDAELSGTTRDGVFLVEKGEIVGPVANVRWTNRMTDVFQGIEAVSKERSVEFMDLPQFSPHTNHVPSLYSTAFTVHASQPRER